MISFPRRTTLVLGILAPATMASVAAFAGDVIRNANHCAAYGPGVVDLGNGTCGRIRIDDTRTWNGGTASAGLRSDGLGMLPGAGNARHLHVQANPDFR